MEKILVDDYGYNQFIEELERLKLESDSIATRGIEEAENAVGDGWHDNFAFEESMRESRTVANKINKMIEEKQTIKVIKKTKLKDEFVNIDDVIKLEIIYNEDDIEEEIVKLTGKYIPNTEIKTKEITLNSPIGKVIYKKKIGTTNEYKVNDKVIKVKIIEKTNVY